MITKEVEIDRFAAKSDTGKLCIIVVFQQYIEVATLRNPHGEIPSLKRYATLNGFHVNTTSDSEAFEVVETQEMIRKV